MAIFEVYVPENATAQERALDARLLGERASILALILPFVWLAWHRLWFALGVYVLFTIALAGIGASDYAAAATAFSFLPGIYLFLEGNNLISAKWKLDGFHLADVVEGDTHENAELRWIARQQLTGNGQNLSGGKKPSGTVSGLNNTPVDDRAEFGLFAEDQT